MLVVHTAVLGCEDPDVLLISKKHNTRLADEGRTGGHRGVGACFTPSGQLQKARMQQCGFKLEQETDAQWLRVVASYIREMRQSYRVNRSAWDMVLSWQRIVVVSRELEAPRALRTVLARDVLAKLGARYAGEL